jgi:hypothetical protein
MGEKFRMKHWMGKYLLAQKIEGRLAETDLKTVV